MSAKDFVTSQPGSALFKAAHLKLLKEARHAEPGRFEEVVALLGAGRVVCRPGKDLVETAESKRAFEQIKAGSAQHCSTYSTAAT
jgi:hypothetical protein